jgi:antitoxin VapB
MLPYVRHQRVNPLAEEARKILNPPTQTDAIRQALEQVVNKEEGRAPLAERLEALRAKYNTPSYDTLEPVDDKAILDEMWRDNDVHR